MFNIMIVDDKEIFRRQFKRFPIFKNNPDFCIAYEAQNGAEALEILSKNKVDIVVTDIKMPIMDGLDLLERIKKENLCGCVILLSEYAEFSFAQKGLELGAFDYIVKPIELEKLAELLNRFKGFIANQSVSTPSLGKSQLERITEYILHNDLHANQLLGDIMDEMAKADEPDYVLSDKINDIFARLKNEVLAKRQYLTKLMDTDALFSISITSRAAARKETDQALGKIIHAVNKFNVGENNELIKAVCNSILQNVGHNISLQKISEMHFVNKSYLSHLFHQETGISFGDYANMVKMEYAKRRIESTDIKIYELSEEMGYSDTEYFSKVFKLYTGFTPTAYRAMIKEKP